MPVQRKRMNRTQYARYNSHVKKLFTSNAVMMVTRSENNKPWYIAKLKLLPDVWWFVAGRRSFDTSVPAMIRKAWKVGDYGKRH